MSVKFVVIMAILFLAIPAWAQDPVIPTVPVQQLNDDMNAAANNINSLPDSVTAQLPVAPSPTVLFGYVRWLFSYDTAQELLGQKMAPLGMALFHLLMVIIPLLTFYLIINIAVAILKFVTWVFNIIVKLIELVPIFQ